jgi:hypothetical protein
MMKNFTDHTIYFQVRDAGLVSSQYEFSTLCGRGKSWFSCLVTRKLPISVTALGILSCNIERMATLECDAGRVRRLLELRDALRAEMARRCAERATEYAR